MEREVVKLKIRSDYNEYTGPRYCSQGASSGEEFYHTLLNASFVKAYQKDQSLVVDLDDTAGYLSSFLDEAFGNLIFDFSAEIIRPRLKIISIQEPDWETMILNEVFSDWEKRRLNDVPPKKTIDHSAWYKLIDNQLISKIWI